MDLYISDLDGTLLNSEKKISRRTGIIINELIDSGLNFTIATARPPDLISDIISPINLKLPAIFHNGVFVFDIIKKKYLTSYMFETEVLKAVLQLLEENKLSPFIYALDKEGNRNIHYKGLLNYGQDYYVKYKSNLGDKRFKKVDIFNERLFCNVYAILIIDKDEVLVNIYKKLEMEYDVNCNYMQDTYSKYYWLEITNKNASKKSAAQFLKEYLKADRLICFGDNLNDLSMFEISDSSYAVYNAHDTLKKASTRVIGTNDGDGVAKFLSSVFANGNNLYK